MKLYNLLDNNFSYVPETFRLQVDGVCGVKAYHSKLLKIL